MSGVKNLWAGGQSPVLSSTPEGKASRVKINETGELYRALLLQIVSRAAIRAKHSSDQRFEFLEVPVLARQAKSARLVHG
jgi:hypothetical protein